MMQEPRWQLMESMYLLRSIHDPDFCNLVEGHEVHYGEYLVDAVHLVVTDPPYNLRQIREDRQSSFDKFSIVDMKELVSFRHEVMNLGRYGHMFCTALQFGSCYKLLVNEVKEMYDINT